MDVNHEDGLWADSTLLEQITGLASRNLLKLRRIVATSSHYDIRGLLIQNEVVNFQIIFMPDYFGNSLPDDFRPDL